LNEDVHAKAGLCQELKVYRCPGKPRHEPSYLDLPALQQCESFSDDSEASSVEISEGNRGCTARDSAIDEPRGVSPLLDGDLRHSWQRIAVLIERSRIADHKDLGVARHGKIRLNANPTSAICRNAQPFTSGGGGNPGGPNQGPTRDSLIGDNNSIRINFLNGVPEAYFNP
jgi:hypothetical protein